MRRSLTMRGLALGLLALAMLSVSPAWAQTKAEVAVEEFTLDNGMKFLVVPRPELTTVGAGWVARVGSANERPGITGISHLFEHMMFKGTHIVGTTDIQRDLEIIDAQEAIQDQIREIYADQRRRWRLGEIDDPFDPENRTEEQIQLEEEFQALIEEQRELMIKDEFDKIYTTAGGSSMNAGTSEDFTIYFITVPANKLELWFWMESDRLMNPVLREFYSERDVVYEERRLRLESTPTGKYREQFNAMFWASHPYGWPVIGWPSDLRVISKEQADAYFSTYYAPNNLTVSLVGNFDLAEVKELAKRYFGRIPRGERTPPDVVTLEMEQIAEKRMTAECDCQPETQIRYHTVPFMHADSYSLDVLAELMNGRTGRLYKGLVLNKEIASSARAGQSSDKYAGSFSFRADTKGEATPAELEAAWYEELKQIIDVEIPTRELQKVKNRIQADAFRQLESPFFLMLQLLIYDNNGDWHYLNDWAGKTMAVTAADVKRVAEKYLTPENRAVAQFTRKAGTTEEVLPPGVADLSPQAQQMFKQQLGRVRQIEDPEKLEEILAQIEQSKAQAPPEFAKAMTLMADWIRGRIDELSEQGGE